MVRFKHRYFTVEVNPPRSLQKQQFFLNSHGLQNCLAKKVEELHGEFGAAAVEGGFAAKYCNKWTRVAVIRCRHGPHRLLASALPLVTSAAGIPLSIRTLYTGATLRQCYRFVQRYQRRQLDKLWSQTTSQKERLAMEQAFMDLKPLENFTGPHKSVNKAVS